jgi:hypothetical protein
MASCGQGSRSGLAVALLMAGLASLATWAASRGRSADDGGTADTAVRRDYPRSEQFHAWAQRTFVPGRTRYEEVVAILGKNHQNLDRPLRDKEIAIVYDLTQDLGIPPRFVGRGQYIVFTFNRWGVLTGAGAAPALAICGFCPHVYAFDGDWRLEGKMLAGCVGASREGVDTLLLPRAAERDGAVRLRFCNIAPEVEYIDQVRLGAVPLVEGEDLDVGVDGRPYAWTPGSEIVVGKRSSPRVFLGDARDKRVLVLEVRNTFDFEVATRDSVLSQSRPGFQAPLIVYFDDGSRTTLQPLGTKLLRRVVVPISVSARNARIEATGSYWEVRRLWTGSGRPAERETVWRDVGAAEGSHSASAGLLRERDGKRLRLEPMETVALVFAAPRPRTDGRRWGFVLRMTGYYEFVRDAGNEFVPSASK